MANQKKPSTPAPKAAPKADNRNIYIVIGATAAMLLLAGLVVFISNRGKDTEGTVLAVTQPVKVDGSLPEFSDTGEDAAVGKAAPVAEAKDFDGTVRRVPVKGKATMLVFAAHWCPHCGREVPLIAKWMQDNGQKGAEVVLASTAVKPAAVNYPPADWLTRTGYKGLVVADDENGTLANAYGATGWPTIVFINADGKVVKRTSGEQPLDVLNDGISKALASAK